MKRLRFSAATPGRSAADFVLFVICASWRSRSGRLRLVDIGWGYDADQPVRPWPTWRDNRLKHCTRFCVCWFGLFFGVAREHRHG